jgi:hypothetical protein
LPENVNGVIFAPGGYAGGPSLFAVDGELRCEQCALLMNLYFGNPYATV